MWMVGSPGNGKGKFSELMTLQYYSLIMFLWATSSSNYHHYPEDEDDKINYKLCCILCISGMFWVRLSMKNSWVLLLSRLSTFKILLTYIAFDEALLLLQHAASMLGAKRHGEMIKTWIYISCLLSSSMTTWADSHTTELSTAWNISTPAGWSGTGILLSSAALGNLLHLVTVEGPNTDLPAVTLHHFQRRTVS